MNGTIRQATPDDLSAMLEIYRPYIEQSVISFEMALPSPEDFQQRVLAVQKDLPWLIFEGQDGSLLGYAYAGKHRARAAYQWSADVSVYTPERAHGKGVAVRLYNHILTTLKVLGYYNAYAGITIPNPKSVYFHQKMGFEPIGVYKKVGYKFGQWHDVGWWSLVLQSHPESAEDLKAPRSLPELLQTHPDQEWESWFKTWEKHLGGQ